MFGNSLDQNEITLEGANQFLKDTIGYKKELDSCKYIDQTIGLKESEGCFTSMIENYDVLQGQLKQDSKMLDHYLQIYNNIGNPNRLKMTVDGFKYDNDSINVYDNDNSFLTRKDNQQKLKEIAEKIKKKEELKKKREAEKAKKGQEAEPHQSDEREQNEPITKSKVSKYSTQEDILNSLHKFGFDFNSKCKNNQKLKTDNPKCYEFFKNKLSGLTFDPNGVQIIEFYRLTSTLRRMLTLEMWNEMYDACAVNIIIKL